MKIEFLEGSQDDGHIIAIINGQQKIVRTDKTVADILKMPGIPAVILEPEKPQPTFKVGDRVSMNGQEAVITHEATSEPFKPDASETEIQREDLVKVVSMVKGLSDAGGQELAPRQGVYTGGIYRVYKVHQTLVTLPDKPDELTRIINSLEVIDDKSPRPELIILFPNEVVLYQKRKKSHSVVELKKSTFLKCQECGAENAFVLNGDKYEGPCKCGFFNSIERIILPCDNEKCLNVKKERNTVSLFLSGDKFSGACGNCKQGMERSKDAVMA